MTNQEEQVTYESFLTEILDDLHVKSEELILLRIFIERIGMKEEANKFISSIRGGVN